MGSVWKLSEKDVQKASLEYLAKLGIFHFRNNTGAFSNPKTGSFVRFGAKGSPDIIACVNIRGLGIWVGFEVKSSVGKLSEFQKAFKNNLEEAGGYYYMIKNLKDLAVALADVNQSVLSKMNFS